MTIALTEIDKLKVATNFNELAEHENSFKDGILTITFNDKSKIYVQFTEAYTQDKPDYGDVKQVKINDNLVIKGK